MPEIKMSKEELIELFDHFISENGLAQKFVQFIEHKGYSEEEYDNIIAAN